MKIYSPKHFNTNFKSFIPLEEVRAGSWFIVKKHFTKGRKQDGAFWSCLLVGLYYYVQKQQMLNVGEFHFSLIVQRM